MKIQSTYLINDEVVNDLKKILEEYTIIESVEIHENDPSKKIYLGKKIIGLAGSVKKNILRLHLKMSVIRFRNFSVIKFIIIL